MYLCKLVFLMSNYSNFKLYKLLDEIKIITKKCFMQARVSRYNQFLHFGKPSAIDLILNFIP